MQSSGAMSIFGCSPGRGVRNWNGLEFFFGRDWECEGARGFFLWTLVFDVETTCFLVTFGLREGEGEARR